MTQSQILALTQGDIDTLTDEQSLIDDISNIKAYYNDPANDQPTKDTLQTRSTQFKVRLHAVRNPPPPPPPLPQYKAAKKAVIDNNTGVKIAAGYAHNGVTLSTSQTAQARWTALYAKKDAAGQFPKNVPTQDDQTYQIATVLEFEGIYDGIFTQIETEIGNGLALKQQVDAATDHAGVDAVDDNSS